MRLIIMMSLILVGASSFANSEDAGVVTLDFQADVIRKPVVIDNILDHQNRRILAWHNPHDIELNADTDITEILLTEDSEPEYLRKQLNNICKRSLGPSAVAESLMGATEFEVYKTKSDEKFFYISANGEAEITYRTSFDDRGYGWTGLPGDVLVFKSITCR